MLRFFGARAILSRFTFFSLFACISLILINGAALAYAEQNNILPLVNSRTSSLSSSSSPFLQYYQFLNPQPIVGTTSLPFPSMQQVAAAVTQSSPLPPPPVQPPPILNSPSPQIIPQPATTGSTFQPGTTLFPSQTNTFPPSVFPPTSSALPTSSTGTQTSLSPWFPSLPAIGCGGTFSLTIVGDVSSSGQTSSSSSNNNNNNNNNHDNGGVHHGKDGKKTLALQVNSAGGVDLTQQSVQGRFFIGQHNVDNNQANNFDIKDVLNNCQVITFSR